jgi:hypothetical protein
MVLVMYSSTVMYNGTVMYNPQEIANTSNDYFSTVADTPIRNIKKDNDPRFNVNPSNYLINKLNSTFPRINWKCATRYEIDKIGKSLKAKIQVCMMKFP